MSESTFTARPAFHGLLRPAGEGRGVIVMERSGLGLATVVARKGRAGPLAARVKERLGVDLSAGRRQDTSGALSLMGTGPGIWLATHEQGTTPLLSALRENIGDLAAVSDQSDGYAVLRLTGPDVREALAKFVFIDLHPGAFSVGSVASGSRTELANRKGAAAGDACGRRGEEGLYREGVQVVRPGLDGV